MKRLLMPPPQPPGGSPDPGQHPDGETTAETWLMQRVEYLEAAVAWQRRAIYSLIGAVALIGARLTGINIGVDEILSIIRAV